MAFNLGETLAMRILHIGKQFAPSHGGIETFLLDLCRHSHALGIKQGVLVHAADQQATDGADLGEFPFLDHLDRVPTWGQLGYAPISPAFPHRLSRALRRFNPDVLHLHLPNPSAFWVLMNRQARQLPWVIHWHADAWSSEYETVVRRLYPLYRPFERALLQRAARVIVTSPPYLEASQALQSWHDKCVVIPLSLDTQRLGQHASGDGAALWLGNGALRVLAVGRLTTYKGFAELIKAASSAAVDVVIAGEGSERESLQTLINATGVADRVRLMGAVSDPTRNQLLSSCDVVCLPSLNRAEAFGISVLEAMAQGKPAVVSSIRGSGLPWLVQDGITGWHVPPGEPVALAATLSRLNANRALLTDAGQQAAQRHHAHFEFSAVIKQLIEVQQHALHTSS